MAIGWQQLLIVLVLVLVLFGGRGRISSLMGDMAKGIRSFKKGLNEDDETETDQASSRRAELSHDRTDTPVHDPAAQAADKPKA